MHAYSINVNDSTRVLYLVVPLSLVASWILNRIILDNLDWYNTHSWIADVPSSGLALFGILYKLFDLYLWKWLTSLGFLKTPDLSGIYEGMLRSSRDENVNSTRITIKIEQTLSKIRVSLSTPLSSSRSEMANILVDEPDGPLLVYEFINDHHKIADSSLTMHRGLARLSLCADSNELSGTFTLHLNEATMEKYK